MKRVFLTAVWLSVVCLGFAQDKNYWKQTSVANLRTDQLAIKNQPSNYLIYELDLNTIKQDLSKSPLREASNGRTDNIITFPDADGQLKQFRVMEASVLHPDLAAKYPGIKSYAGQGVDDPGSIIRFSVSDQLGLHGMIRYTGKSTCYIDPYTTDRANYIVYARKDLPAEAKSFECETLEGGTQRPADDSGNTSARTNDKKLRKYRLALSCTAEYGNIFAGSGTDAQKISNILAQMNVTMTRVNGVYESDLAITMELVPNNDAIIYYGSTSADPWGTEYNTKTQQVIDAAIGDANYDIGHNFNTSGGGNAGCIGCVCVSGSKGSGFTGRSDPTGDAFDIDYVAHEMGHQFGGYHVMNTCSRSGSGSTEVEPASGSSIMGYAGICSTNIQSNSDDYFAYVNIRDISANVQSGASSGCAQVVSLSNNPPVANAGSDYTIPKSTAFVLRGSATDPDGDVLTYTWEQNDPEQAPGSGTPQSTWTQGPLFRSKKGTTSPDRYMPVISDVVAGNLAPTWEVVPSVARTMEFSLTVRDNKAGGGQTSDDLMMVTVNGTAGPFLVSYPNTSVVWNVGMSQTVTWDVAGTSSSPISCAGVNILLSTDGGYTYPVTLVSNTPNDGSQTITVPNNVSATCRIKVEAADNIFYDISNVNFSIEGAISCNPTVPTGLAASNVGSNSATLSWTAVSGATYDVQYRISGTSTWTTVSSGSNQLSLSGLSAETTYEAQVRSVCSSSETSSYSSSVSFTTTVLQLTYCSSNGKSVSDEYIGNVKLGTINNTSSGTSGGYADYTGISANLTAGSAYSITVTPVWTGTTYSEGYSAWIDYNQDGDFADSGEQIWSKSASKTSPVTGSFTVPSTALSGATRLRVSMKYNGIPTSCESFSYGEVEDYTMVISSSGGGDTQSPTTPSNLAASNITETSANLSWTASTDNVGVVSYSVYLGSTLQGSASSTSYALTGLTGGTSYSVSIIAFDAAGNQSTAGQTSFTTTSAQCTDVTLTLKLDNYPEETSWTLVDDGGSTVSSGGTYGNLADGSTVTDVNCLPAGCYTFTIKDSYGDGICCSYGQGSYSLTASGGTVLASGASFAYSEATTFCVGGASRPGQGVKTEETGLIDGSRIFPNPVKDFLNVYVPKGAIRSLKVYTIDGAIVNQVKILDGQIDVSALKSGTYILSIETYKNVFHERFIKE